MKQNSVVTHLGISSKFSLYFFWDILYLYSINRHNPVKALATIGSEAASSYREVFQRKAVLAFLA